MGLDGLLKNKDTKLSGVQNGGVELRGAGGTEVNLTKYCV